MIISLSDFRKGTLKVSGQINMGGLLKALDAVDHTLPVRIDGYPDRIPYTDVDSYRGYYEDIAIPFASATLDGGPTLPDEPVTVKVFADGLRAAIGKLFEGYKGGDYVCDSSTAVWLANYGTAGGAAVTGVVERDGAAVLTWATDEYAFGDHWDVAKKEDAGDGK